MAPGFVLDDDYCVADLFGESGSTFHGEVVLSEWNLVLVVGLRLLVLNVFVVLYAIGGRKWKFLRRIIGGSLLTLSCLGISALTGTFSWWYLLAFLPLNIGLFMGYGADEFTDKVFRRFLFGLMLGATGFILGLVNDAPVLGSLQLIFAIIASVAIGVTNETPAVTEEATIAILTTGLIPFLV